MSWASGKRVHYCELRQRPLAIYRSPLRRDRFRIIPLYAAVHATAALLVVLAMTLVLVADGSARQIVLAIALPLALFGASDVADGYLSVRMGVDRTLGRVRIGRGARALGAGTILFGVADCLIATIGIVALAGPQ